MSSEEREDAELEEMPGIDYDLEYLLRNRNDEDSINITRGPYNETLFEERFTVKSRKQRLKKLLTPPEPVRSALMPPRTGKEWRSFFLVHLPILQWVWHYQWRYLLPDFISGVTVAVMHIPQGLAYALLAELHPVIGLYTSIVPAIFYAIFGTSKHLSIGTFAVVCLMVGNSIIKVLEALDLEICLENDGVELFVNGSGRYGVCDEAGGSSLCEASNFTCGDLKLNVAVTLSFMTGCIMFLMGLLQLGFFTIFLSESLVSGYTTGAAVHVFTSQLRHVIGVKSLDVPSGILQVPLTWYEVLKLVFKGTVNTASVVITIVAIVILVVIKLLNKFLSKPLRCSVFSFKDKRFHTKTLKWPIPIPGAIVVVILGTAVSYGAKFSAPPFNVTLVGDIPTGPPSFSLLEPRFVPSVIQDAFTIAIVTVTVSISMAKLFAKQYKYAIDSTQELIAYGVMNIGGSLFSSFVSSASLSRSVIQANSGGKTQLVSLVSSLILMVVITALSFLFEPLPRAVLASTIWVALYGMFTQVLDVYKYVKWSSFSDVLIWLVVFLSTVLLGVDLGLGVGVAFSLMVVIVRTILPKSTLLGRARETEIYRDMENFHQVKAVPRVLIFRFQAPLCFLNVAVFRKRLDIVSEAKPVNLASGEPGCLKTLWYKIFHRCQSYRGGSGNHGNANHQSGGGSISRSASFQRALQDDVVSVIKAPPMIVRKDLHTIIVDCAPFGFLDIAGVKALEQAVVDFNTCGIQVLLAAMREGNRDMLERAGFYETCGKEWLFPSIQDAVQHAKHETRLVPMLNDSTASVEDEVALANTNHVQSTESSSVSVINLE